MSSSYQWRGFSSPTYTQVPDEFFDELAPELSEGELRVCLYIIRRTFGFKRENDDISLRQMTDGLRARDGRQLDRGTGMSKSAVARALQGLITKGVIETQRNVTVAHGNEPSTYRLIFATAAERDKLVPLAGQGSGGTLSPQRDRGQLTPLSPQRDKGVSRQRLQPLVRQRDKLPIEEKQTEIQREKASETQDDSTGPGWSTGEPPPDLARWIDDRTHELHDALGNIEQNRGRAAKIWRESGLELEAFLTAAQEARERARRQFGIKTVSPASGLPNRMPYFFSCLTELTKP